MCNGIHEVVGIKKSLSKRETGTLLGGRRADQFATWLRGRTGLLLTDGSLRSRWTDQFATHLRGSGRRLRNGLQRRIKANSRGSTRTETLCCDLLGSIVDGSHCLVAGEQ